VPGGRGTRDQYAGLQAAASAPLRQPIIVQIEALQISPLFIKR
jgi:hypothetical protein